MLCALDVELEKIYVVLRGQKVAQSDCWNSDSPACASTVVTRYPTRIRAFRNERSFAGRIPHRGSNHIDLGKSILFYVLTKACSDGRISFKRGDSRGRILPLQVEGDDTDVGSA